MALAYSMDKIGPMARSAEDCTRIFAAIAGHDPLDRDTLPIDKAAYTYSPSAEMKGRTLKVGWLTNAWKQSDYEPSVARNLDAAHKVLQQRFPGLKDASLPIGPWEEAANVTMQSEVASAFSSLLDSGGTKELIDPLGRVGGYVNQSISGADYTTAARVRETLQESMRTLFDSYDVLVAAAQPIPATPLSLNLLTGLTFADPLGAIGNLCGLPALAVPCGFTSKQLPIGIQFVARAGDDAAVLQAGRTFQQASDWHRKHPSIS